MKTQTQTQKQKRDEAQVKVYRQIINTINIDKAIIKFGEKSTKWAIGKYLTGVRERSRLLKEKAEAEKQLREIEAKL